MSAFAIPGLMPLGSPIYDAQPQPLTLRRGLPWFESWSLPLPAGENLTGYTVRAEAVSPCPCDGTRFDLGPLLTDPLAAVIEFSLDSAATLALTAGSYVTSVYLVSPEGVAELLVEALAVRVLD